MAASGRPGICVLALPWMVVVSMNSKPPPAAVRFVAVVIEVPKVIFSKVPEVLGVQQLNVQHGHQIAAAAIALRWMSSRLEASLFEVRAGVPTCRRAFKTTQVCALNFTQGL